MTETVTISADDYRMLLNAKQHREDARSIGLRVEDLAAAL